MFTFSVVVCVLTHPSLTLTAPLSLCGSCLWVMSCLVSWPLQLGALPVIVSLSSFCFLFLNVLFSASSSLTLSPPSSHHRGIFLQDHQPSSQLVPACRQPPPLRSLLHGGFLLLLLLLFCQMWLKKITPLNPKRQRSSSKIFCQVTFYIICCVKNKLFIFWSHLTGPAVRP